MRPGTLLTIAAAVFLIILVVLLQNAVEDVQRIRALRGPDISPPQAARPAPDFRLRTFDGGTLALSDFRGKIVVVNFWASWCTPCKQEMPNLERLWRAYRSRGVVVLGVDVQDDPDDARAFLRALQITYPNVHDPGQERMTAYQVVALPTTVFVDRGQRLRGRFVGGYVGDAGYTELQRQVDVLLAGP